MHVEFAAVGSNSRRLPLSVRPGWIPSPAERMQAQSGRRALVTFALWRFAFGTILSHCCVFMMIPLFHTAIGRLLPRYALARFYAALRRMPGMFPVCRHGMLIAEYRGLFLPFGLPVFQPDEYPVKFR